MENKILTIAIPTYNRSEKIQEQILSLIPQITEEVEVIIIDNNSDTSVSTLIDESVKTKVKVIRNHINIGGAANIARCFEACRTEWLWTLSDDDSISKDAVNIILSTIKSANDICYINFNNCQTYSSNNFANILDKGGLYQDLYYMSVCVYNINKLQYYLHHYYRALSTMQPGIYMIIKYLDDHPYDKCLISDSQIISSGSADISWNRMTFVFASLYLLDLLRDKKKQFNASLFKSITSDCGYCIYKSYKNKVITLTEVLDSFHCIIKRRGVLNTLRYDFKVYLKYLVLCVLNI